jgi:mannose-6-phosphate isomerase-like protein (cupin superfamily)
MRTLLVLSCLLSTSLGAQPAAAQAPASQPAAQTPPATGAPAVKPPVRRRPAPAAAVTVTLTVTDEKGGAPIGGVKVTTNMDGTEKDAQTTAGGIARFLSVKPGEYRVRFEHENYITLERDIVVKGVALDMNVPLSAAPAPPPKAPAPAAVSSNNAPAGDARALSIVDFLESNHLSGRDPSRTDQLGCTASAKTTLIQVRDSIDEKSQADADEVLYVVAGEGTLRLGNKDVGLEAGGLAVVPRGTVRGLTRKGKNPLMLLSVVSGPACTGGMTNSK